MDDEITVVLARESDEERFVVIGEGDWQMICHELHLAGRYEAVNQASMWVLMIEHEPGDRPALSA